jgi:hypothetical protein
MEHTTAAIWERMAAICFSSKQVFASGDAVDRGALSPVHEMTCL